MGFSEVDSKNVSITSQSYLILTSFHFTKRAFRKTLKDRINDT